MKTLLLFPLCALYCIFSNTSSAHSDKIIKIEDGKLVGLPKRYLPASFDLKTGVLIINNKEVKCGPPLRSVLKDVAKHNVEISSSWYHHPSILPPYLSVRITPKKGQYTYQILIDMVKSSIIEVEIEVQETANSSRIILIDPSWWKEDQENKKANKTQQSNR